MRKQYSVQASRGAAWLLLFATLLAGLDSVLAPCWASDLDSKPATSTPSFFESHHLSTFLVELGPAEVQRLAHWPRKYVSGKVTVDGRVFEKVGVRLKGTGTFEPISRHPNLTLKFNWQIPDQEFFGLTKIFLNNSRQDPTFLSELAAGSVFADAGVAVPRITQGRVQLNERNFGPCVVAEAVNKRFLKRHFNSSHGNLYEGVFQDLRAGLEQDNGDTEDRADLRALGAAAAQADPGQRRMALAKVLDLDGFLNFLAVEMMVANWDGYALHQNNYRVYHNPVTDRFAFIPHGLDNTFFESGLSLMPPRKSLLAAALLATPQDRAAFRQRVAGLLPRVLVADKIQARLLAAADKLKQGANPAEAQAIDRHATLFLQRVRERIGHLQAELQGDNPPTPVFNQQGLAPLQGWTSKPDWNDSPVERLAAPGKTLLGIRAAEGYCFGSWRLATWLPAGRYRLEATASTTDVQGLPSRTGSGAGVRVLGTMRGSGLQGSQLWAPLQHEFSVQEGCEWVELIAELRAFRGSTFFDLASFRLMRLAP